MCVYNTFLGALKCAAIEIGVVAVIIAFLGLVVLFLSRSK